MTPLVVAIILVALAFDFINGFHDAANSIATVVSTRVLTPGQAVLWAAFFNFVAAFVFGVGVAKTMGKGLVDVSQVNEQVILAALIGAIVWDLLTWWWGLPTSSSHALIGGYAGAALAKTHSLGVLIWTGWSCKWGMTLLFIVLAPLVGMILGNLFMLAVLWICRRVSPARVDGFFRKGQLVSAAAYSLGHGGNDAQKTMGIIMGLLVASGFYAKDREIPWWIILTCHAAIALGTLSGGWRIVKTMGQKITKLKPVGGFCAESAGAVSLFGATALGVPVSTTHTITGAIVGVGSVQRFSAVRWGVAGRIVWAWILTIPAAAAVAAVSYLVLALF